MYLYALFIQDANALMRLHAGTGSPEPSLLVGAIIFQGCEQSAILNQEKLSFVAQMERKRFLVHVLKA